MKRLILTSLGVLLAANLAWAGTILDSDFFSGIPHTLVTFETDGSGSPVILSEGASQSMPYDEYTALGFTFNPAIAWVNDAGLDFDAAQAIGGSPEIGIPAAANDDYFIDFLVPVRAFGFWVINNNTAVEIPVFEAYGAADLIETVRFEGAAIDGTIGVADYGFLGIMAEENITRIYTKKDATVFDNFMFSAVPEPATIALLGLGSLFLGRSRKFNKK